MRSNKLSILNRLDKMVSYSDCTIFYYCVVLMTAILSCRGSKWEKNRWPKWIHSEPTSKHANVVTIIEPSRSRSTLEFTDNNRAIHNPRKYGYAMIKVELCRSKKWQRMYGRYSDHQEPWNVKMPPGMVKETEPSSITESTNMKWQPPRYPELRCDSECVEL